MVSEACGVLVKDDIVKSWISIGLAENLATASDIAYFLINLYIRTKEKDMGRSEIMCSQCRSHLALVCTGCSYPPLSVHDLHQAQSSGDDRPLQGASPLQQSMLQQQASVTQAQPPPHTQADIVQEAVPQNETEPMHDEDLSLKQTPSVQHAEGVLLQLPEIKLLQKDPSLPQNEAESVHREGPSLQQTPVVQHAEGVRLQLPEIIFLQKDPSLQTLPQNEAESVHGEGPSLEQTPVVQHAEGVILQLPEKEFLQKDPTLPTLPHNEAESVHGEGPSLEQTPVVQHAEGVLLQLPEKEFLQKDPTLPTLPQNEAESVHGEGPSLEQTPVVQHAEGVILQPVLPMHETDYPHKDPSLQTLPESEAKSTCVDLSLRQVSAGQHAQGVLLRNVFLLHEREYPLAGPPLQLQALPQNKSKTKHVENPSLQQALGVQHAEGVHLQVLPLCKIDSSHEDQYDQQTVHTLQQIPCLPKAQPLQQTPIPQQALSLQEAPVLPQALPVCASTPKRVPSEQRTQPLLEACPQQKDLSSQKSLNQQMHSPLDSFLGVFEMKEAIDWGLQMGKAGENVQVVPVYEEMDYESGRVQSNKDVENSFLSREDMGSDSFLRTGGGENISFKSDGAPFKNETTASEITETVPRCIYNVTEDRSDQSYSFIQSCSSEVKRSRFRRVWAPKSDPLFVDEMKTKLCASLNSRGKQSPVKQNLGPYSGQNARADTSKHNQKPYAVLLNQFQFDKELKVSLVRCDYLIEKNRRYTCRETVTVSKNEVKEQEHVSREKSQIPATQCVQNSKETTGGEFLLEENGAAIQSSLKIGAKSLGVKGQPVDVVMSEKLQKESGPPMVPISVFVCTHCQQAFTQESLLTIHMKSHISTEKPNETISKTHPDHPFICKECGKSYKSKNSLYWHLRTHSKSGDLFKCDLCGLSFRLKRNLLHHKKKKHAQDATLRCKQCDFQCAADKDMKSHMKKMHWKRTAVQCEICGVHVVPQAFKAHIRLHKGEKPFPCDKCEQTFRTVAQLNTHVKAYHRDIKKRFDCDQCGRSFVKAQTLRDHMFSHTGEKPFKCPQCPSSFVRKDYLVKHMRSHTGDKPFTCDICKNEFGFVSSLNEHKKKAHPGIKNQDSQKSNYAPGPVDEVLVVPARTFNLLTTDLLFPVFPESENVGDIVYTTSTLDI